MPSPRVIAIDAPRPRAAGRLARRNALIEAHVPLVRSIAARIKATLPASFDTDDLEGTGYVALVRAADRYRPAEHGGATFGSYARQIVRGAMLDSVSGRHYIENTRIGMDDAPERGSCSVIETEIDAGRLRRRISREISYLAPAHRAVLAVCYTSEDVTLARAADETGSNVWTIGRLRAAALEALRRRCVG
jgi:RNA polymerase sigma factor (sigma-70 family)